MSIPFKELMRQPAGSFEYYEPEGKYQKTMTSVKSYAVRAKVRVKTEKFRCISINSDHVKTLVKVTIL